MLIREVPYEEIRAIQGGPVGGDPTGCTTFAVEGKEQDILEYLNTINGAEYETLAQAAADDFVVIDKKGSEENLSNISDE